MISDDISAGIPASTPSPLEELRLIYDRIDAAQSASLSRIASRGPALACPDGCGACCEGFVPDVLPIEATYLADWLIREGSDLATRAIGVCEAGARTFPPCPFHDPAHVHGHCGVYPARPLICRLFGFSAVRDRRSVESYALCKKMPSRRGRRSWAGDEIEEDLGSSLPDMGDFSAAVAALVPDDVGRRELLTSALPSAIRRMALRIYLAGLDTNRDPDGGEPERPAPKAA